MVPIFMCHGSPRIYGPWPRNNDNACQAVHSAVEMDISRSAGDLRDIEIDNL